MMQIENFLSTIFPSPPNITCVGAVHRHAPRSVGQKYSLVVAVFERRVVTARAVARLLTH
mgnify:CR=1 FL=1